MPFTHAVDCFADPGQAREAGLRRLAATLLHRLDDSRNAPVPDKGQDFDAARNPLDVTRDLPRIRTMDVMPVPSVTEAPRAWVVSFTESWRVPTGADAFADEIEPWLDPQVRLIQPPLPTLVGRMAFRERFARPLFGLIPDLHGEVERSAVGDDCAYIELTLRGTLGGRPISWRVCDRMTFRDGLVIERETYCDSLPLLRAVITRPRAWLALAWLPFRRPATTRS